MKARTFAGALVILAITTATTPAGSAPDPIAIDVTPRSCVEPCNVRLLVRIVPDEANRRVTINAESDVFGRRSSRTLDGDKSPAVYEMILQNLEAGVYDVDVSIDRAAASPSRRTSQFSVHDGNGPDETPPAKPQRSTPR
jgi:hypothetical protein